MSNLPNEHDEWKKERSEDYQDAQKSAEHDKNSANIERKEQEKENAKDCDVSIDKAREEKHEREDREF